MYAVDGAFLAQRVSGIQRYSLELLAELDKQCNPGEVELVTPPGVQLSPPERQAGALYLQCDPAARLPGHCGGT